MRCYLRLICICKTKITLALQLALVALCSVLTSEFSHPSLLDITSHERLLSPGTSATPSRTTPK